MNELPPDAKALLALAKTTHEPDPFVKQRVRQQVYAAVAAGALLSASSVKAATLAEGVANGAVKGGLLSTLTGKVGVAVVALGVLGGGGALLHAHNAHRAEASSRSEAHMATVDITKQQPARETATEQLAPAAEPPASPAPVAAARPVRAAAQAAGTSLPAELRILKAASEALARGDVARGGALLREHRQRFAQPVLREERDGLTLVMRCQQGDDAARTAANQFLRDHGGSMLTATIKQACRLERAR